MVLVEIHSEFALLLYLAIARRPHLSAEVVSERLWGVRSFLLLSSNEVILTEVSVQTTWGAGIPRPAQQYGEYSPRHTDRGWEENRDFCLHLAVTIGTLNSPPGVVSEKAKENRKFNQDLDSHNFKIILSRCQQKMTHTKNQEDYQSKWKRKSIGGNNEWIQMHNKE